MTLTTENILTCAVLVVFIAAIGFAVVPVAQAEPAVGSVLRGVVDRRDRDQGP